MMEFVRRIVCCLILVLLAGTAPLDAPSISPAIPDAQAALFHQSAPEQAPCGALVMAQASCALVCVTARPAAANAQLALLPSPAFGRPPDQRIRASSGKPDPNPPKLNTLA
jgi:hypothetical protein